MTDHKPPLMFEAFKASMRRVENLQDVGAIDPADGPNGGYVYEDGCYIEDNNATDPAILAMGKHYLLIGREDWIDDDLDRLAKILWAYHYIPESIVPAELRGGDLDTFIQGYCDARGLVVDGDLFGVEFSGADAVSAEEAITAIERLARTWRLKRKAGTAADMLTARVAAIVNGGYRDDVSPDGIIDMAHRLDRDATRRMLPDNKFEITFTDQSKAVFDR